MANGASGSGLVQGSAVALGGLLVASATGLVPVAGLWASPGEPSGGSSSPSEPAPAVAAGPPSAPSPQPAPAGPPEPEPAEPVEPAPAPSVAPSAEPQPPAPEPAFRRAGRRGPVRLSATAGRRQILRTDAEEREVSVVCRVDVDRDAAEDAARRPVDLVLVLDTSGSMRGAMRLLKRATLGIAERVAPGDRVAVVRYSSNAEVVFSGELDDGADARLERAVTRLTAGGGTNLSGGLLRGARVLRELRREAGGERAQRILLLTDGKANAGVTAPKELEQLVGGFRAEGLAVSSVGLGANYEERLLGTLADAGGGAYHYAARPEDLSRIYTAELEALQRLVARRARLALRPSDGVRVARVASWPSSPADGATEVSLGDLAAGRSLEVVARLRVDAAGAPGALRNLVEADLAYEPLEVASAPRSVPLEPLQVALSDDPAAVEGSAVEEVARAIQEVEVAERLRKARQAARDGRRDEARRMVQSVRGLTGSDELEYEAPDGEVRRVELDRLADGVAAGEGSRRGRAAAKSADAFERSAAR